MIPAPDLRAQGLIDAVALLIGQRLDPPEAALAQAFLRQTLEGHPIEDLGGYDAERVFGQIVSLWTFVRQRPPGQALVRAFSPTLEEHGWHCDQAVIELALDDMPFLVDSVRAELARLNLGVRLVLHPVLRVARDGHGVVEALGDDAADAHPESIMHLHVLARADPERLAAAEEGVRAVLAQVQAAVHDWALMRARCLALASDAPTPAEAAFLTWLAANHFTFLGVHRHALAPDAESPSDEAGLLGIARLAADNPENGLGFSIDDGPSLLLTKGLTPARIHRPVPMDVVVVRRDAAVWVFLGLFTADVYTDSPRGIPVVNDKIAAAITATGRRPGTHDGRKLLAILETLPREELFQADIETLAAIALGVLRLQEQPRPALFLRPDPFGRFVSCLVFLPRDRHDTALRREVQGILEQALDGTALSFSTQVSDAPLARFHLTVRVRPGARPLPDARAIEARIADAARAWPDALAEALVSAHGEERGLARAARFADAFPAGYRERFGAQQAVADIARIEAALDPAGPGFAMALYRALEDAPHEVRFKIVRPGQPLPLSDIVPLLENLGLRVIGEMPFDVRLNGGGGGGDRVWLHDVMLSQPQGRPLDVGQVRGPFQDCFARLLKGEVENDRFNRLVTLAGLTWREVVILRAYARFLRQTTFPFGLATLADALAAHPALARALIDLFRVRFDPERADDRDGAQKAARAEIENALDAVDNPDEDRVLRTILTTMLATVRTNAWQVDDAGEPGPVLALKFDSAALDHLPEPRPWREIFVYSPRVEAVHLRGGPVARGGIRWSDRREDFRTEILGLMKAQRVKNAVIVPVGAKGGFVVRRPPAEGGRDAQQAEGVACYSLFIRALLDLTDTLNGAEVVPPPRVVRHDGDDPYLVVAADKGTATFSDIANRLALEAGFWLGDAFASGGSNGYDHKAMGITARGAWVAVRRHFREAGHDIQTTPTTVIGVGDMSGDVFGNGMLLSRQLKLIGAFNHLHVFVDPDPDPEQSWAERERLFRLPRSSWGDYNPKFLSPGGAVFSRHAKRLDPSPEIRARFELPPGPISPEALIRALLGASVDLLWFGGIGTFIKAHDEPNALVGDRANDAVRLNGRSIRAKVVGEGANLGITQRGRIELALAGVRLNTDAIDNAAGVDCSDHEVNIKILLGSLVAAGEMTDRQRNTLLAEMTDEVGALVLRHNVLQTQAISLTIAGGPEDLDAQVRLMRALERAGRLDRALESLPDDEAVQKRLAEGRGLTRPEGAVLLSYAKIWLFDQLMASDLPDDPFLEGEAIRYFPEVLGRRFPDAVRGHPLRREIISTVATNSLLNRAGGIFVSQMTDRTGHDPVDVTRAYLVSRDGYDARALWDAIEALDGQVPAAVQLDMLRAVNRLLAHGTVWLLRHAEWPLDLAGAGAALDHTVGVLRDGLPALLPSETLAPLIQRAGALEAQGVPSALAFDIAALDVLAAANDIARVARVRALAVEPVARLYFAVGMAFDIEWLRARARDLDRGSPWTRLAVAASIEDLEVQQRLLTQGVLECAGSADDPEAALACWRGRHARLVERTGQVLQDLRAAASVDLAMLTVAARQIRALSGG
ncbi:NAD-glutamate dehydrogenase [Pararhodospirillum oryzae]|uniref:Glutamate dehydrogenase n=1 Tax=Pararhodospirillum oryzae TaxID=478448 RepID=A0A512H3Q2_9PROT|nr:NAD-glutamate dehydrogenase [Pararhodospirillum oryzae]GEO80085.1 glutamate dehydrogenase [Pararhodospirillum oryzae]